MYIGAHRGPYSLQVQIGRLCLHFRDRCIWFLHPDSPLYSVTPWWRRFRPTKVWWAPRDEN